MDDSSADKMKFVVGLGNPGREYIGTRHNVGFEVIETLRRRCGLPTAQRRFEGLLCDAWFDKPVKGRRRVVMFEPMTYMNRSGRAVRQMVDFYKASRQDVLVVLDDMALELGRLRARVGGSAGGHNGLDDVLAQMGGDDVPRLRIGIGSPPPGWLWKDYVLSSFRQDEMPVIGEAIGKAADAVEDWVFDGLKAMMDVYNRKGDA